MFPNSFAHAQAEFLLDVAFCERSDKPFWPWGQPAGQPGENRQYFSRCQEISQYCACSDAWQILWNTESGICVCVNEVSQWYQIQRSIYLNHPISNLPSVILSKRIALAKSLGPSDPICCHPINITFMVVVAFWRRHFILLVMKLEFQFCIFNNMNLICKPEAAVAINE